MRLYQWNKSTIFIFFLTYCSYSCLPIQGSNSVLWSREPLNKILNFFFFSYNSIENWWHNYCETSVHQGFDKNWKRQKKDDMPEHLKLYYFLFHLTHLKYPSHENYLCRELVILFSLLPLYITYAWVETNGTRMGLTQNSDVMGPSKPEQSHIEQRHKDWKGKEDRIEE